MTNCCVCGKKIWLWQTQYGCDASACHEHCKVKRDLLYAQIRQAEKGAEKIK